jgi:nucleotide-binding universal stress UspA family protein
MSSVILAFLAHYKTADAVLWSATRLAELCGAEHINVLVVRRPPFETIVPSEEILTREQEARIRTEEHGRAHALKAAYDRWSAAAPLRGAVTEWFDIEANAGTALKEFGSRSDAIVLKRPCPREPEPEQQALHTALFDTGRPVLVVPPEGASTTFGRHVAIGWRDDPRTVKAVLTALRWIRTAESIDVIEGMREGTSAPILPEIFEEHGVFASLHILPLPTTSAFGAALLSKAHALRSDILVMGAFAHNPLHDLILGGVTRYMLAHADLPVLMRH